MGRADHLANVDRLEARLELHRICAQVRLDAARIRAESHAVRARSLLLREEHARLIHHSPTSLGASHTHDL